MKKPVKLTCIVIILLIGFLSSCSEKDDALLPGEVIAQELQSVISEENIEFVSIIEYLWNDIYDDFRWIELVGTTDFEIDGFFIRVSDRNYNLEQLYQYRVNGNDLELYFIY
jgi:hypothetical protein